MAKGQIPKNAFKKGVAKTDEQRQQISDAMIDKSRQNNINATLRTYVQKYEGLIRLFRIADEYYKLGEFEKYAKLMLEIVKMAKEPEKQEVNLIGQVQKVFVSQNEEKEANNHIDDIIGD